MGHKETTNDHHPHRAKYCCIGWLVFAVVAGVILAVLLFKNANGDVSLAYDKASMKNPGNILGCSHISVKKVWSVGVPKAFTESATRLVDVNQDGALDVIIGFGTGLSGKMKIVCKIYFNHSFPCSGGLVALDGRTGAQLWKHFSDSEVYGLTCNNDLDRDGVNDCVVVGRKAIIEAVSCKDGSLIWGYYKHETRNEGMNTYTPQTVPDLDGDGIVDFIVMHAGDSAAAPWSPTRLIGVMLILSGRTGKVLRWQETPDRGESYYAPQMYLKADATPTVIFATGGETHSGSLWTIPFSDLYEGRINKSQPLLTDDKQGYIPSAVLVDITGDGVEDIVIATFRSTVFAIDGEKGNIIWSYTIDGAETYSIPAPGFYNEDNIPDFMIQYTIGPGFPVYYYTEMTILDGVTGKPIINPSVRYNLMSVSSPLTVSMEGSGNDLYLYWMSNCFDLDGSKVYTKSQYTSCQYEINTRGYSRYKIRGRNLKSPFSIYYSEDHKVAEKSTWINTTKEGQQFLKSHPDYWEKFMKFRVKLMKDTEKKYNLTLSTILPTRPKFITDKGKHVDRGQTGQQARKAIRGQKQQLGDQSYLTGNSLSDNSNSYPSVENEQKRFGDKFAMSDTSKLLNDLLMRSKLDHKDIRSTEDGRRIKSIPRDSQRSRVRRHDGAHDNEGRQTLMATGTLMPTSLHPSHPHYHHSIDVLTVSYKGYSTEQKGAMQANNDNCVDKRIEKAKSHRSDIKSPYYNLSDEAIRERVRVDCQSPEDVEHMVERVYYYNPFMANLGQMIVYRFTVICTCGPQFVETRRQTCSKTLPFTRQRWAAFRGSHGDCHWLKP